VPFTDPARDFLPAGQNFVVSTQEELKRDWRMHRTSIHEIAGRDGWIGGRHIHLTDVDMTAHPEATIV